jgi:conjugative transfer region protein TrbK
MRERLIYWPGVLRFLGLVAIAIALIAAAALLRHHARPPLASVRLAAPSTATSPVMRELVRCQYLGDRATDDPECQAAWSENRRHFFDDDTNGLPRARTDKATRSASQP